MSDPTDIRGKWRHYKGHVYEVLGIAKHSETLEELGVAYQRIDKDEIFVWVRPEEMFKSRAQLEDGTAVVRFERLSGETTRSRVKDLEAQLHEPGYVDALRGVCGEVRGLIPEDFWEKLNKGDDYDLLEALPNAMQKYIESLTAWSDEDRPLPEDSKIEEAHPLNSGEHELYAEAVRMVGAKRSKYALVDLVHWLLVRLKTEVKTQGGPSKSVD